MLAAKELVDKSTQTVVQGNIEIDGNWTLEIAKSKLYQFMQMKHIKPECNFTPIAAGLSTNHLLVMKVSLSDGEFALVARETASNKKLASKLCSLSIVKQLYSLGVIEAFDGSLKQRKPKLLNGNAIQLESTTKRDQSNTRRTKSEAVGNERLCEEPVLNVEPVIKKTSAPNRFHSDNFEEREKKEQSANKEMSTAGGISSALCGNWTIENAKTELHDFLQKYKIPSDYKYTRVTHCSVFMAKIQFFVRKLKRNLSATGVGCTKRAASTFCADAMVQRLYRLGAIKPCADKPKNVKQEQLNEQSEDEDIEFIDLETAIRGNWTAENSKNKLHRFMKANRILSDYQYTVVKPTASLSFTAEMEITLNEGKHYISAQGTGRNKQLASKSCALSMVQQLYGMGIIGPYTRPI